MRSQAGPRMLLLLVPLLVAACGDAGRTRGVPPTGPVSEGPIVVESAALETVDRSETVGPRVAECHVRGVVRNDGLRRLSVTLSFTAFNGRDEVMTQATSPDNVVEAGGRASYRAVLLFLLDGCDRVRRLEITRIETEPA